MKKDAYYFSHDSNARHDIKMLKLRAKFGMEGYGVFWALIENLREAADFKIAIVDAEYIAYDLNLEPTRLIELMGFMFGVGLLATDNEYFWSNRLLESMGLYQKFIGKQKNNGGKGGRPQKVTPEEPKNNPEITQNKPNENPEITQHETQTKAINKGKEIKEIKEDLNTSSLENLSVSEAGEKFSVFFQSTLEPTVKISPAMKRSWAKVFDELIRIDGRTEADIYAVCKWARRDSFWKTNFLSATKLRHKDKAGTYYFDIFLQKINNGVFTNGHESDFARRASAYKLGGLKS